MDKLEEWNLVGLLWHLKIQCGFTWDYVSVRLAKKYGVNLTGSQAQEFFENYFFEKFETWLYSDCPECGEGELVPRLGTFGYFVGCSEYPDCEYKVTRQV